MRAHQQPETVDPTAHFTYTDAWRSFGGLLLRSVNSETTALKDLSLSANSGPNQTTIDYRHYYALQPQHRLDPANIPVSVEIAEGVCNQEVYSFFRPSTIRPNSPLFTGVNGTTAKPMLPMILRASGLTEASDEPICLITECSAEAGVCIESIAHVGQVGELAIRLEERFDLRAG